MVSGFAIVLARLLSPVDYGLMGMLTIFSAVAMCFGDAGFCCGLIQGKEISEDDETSVFCFNIFAGFLLTLSLCAISPLVAVFYQQPILKQLLCVLSLQFMFISLGTVQYALMIRDMDFKRRALVNNAATFLSGSIGIGMACAGLGVWSLIGQILSRYLLSSSLVWLVRPWRPRGRFRWACLRSLWPFSSHMMGTSLLNSIFDNVYSVIIGRFYTPAELGQFTRAYGLAQLPGLAATDAISNVTLPVFSRMQQDIGALRSRLRKSIRTLGAFYFPLMIGLAAVAEPLIRCLLTAKWITCVPYLRILCLSGIFFPLHAMHRNALTALGRSDLVFRSEIVKKVMIIAMIAATVWFGIRIMVWGILVASVLSYAVPGHYTRKLLGYRWPEQSQDILPLIGLSFVMGICVWGITRMDLGGGWLVLTLQSFVGFVTYSILLFASRKGICADAFATLKQLFHRDARSSESGWH